MDEDKRKKELPPETCEKVSIFEIKVGSIHSTTLSQWKMQSSALADRAPNSETLLAEAIAGRNTVFILRNFNGISCAGSNGLFVKAVNTVTFMSEIYELVAGF